MAIPHLLILGGTGEARRLAERLARRGGADITLSLAGRTTKPAPQAGRVRTGGFGGADGLAAFIREAKVSLVVDATHPFAARISANATTASRLAGCRIIRLERPPWLRSAGDRWVGVSNIAEAALALDGARRTVLLAIGRQELAPFRAMRQHAYVVRSVDPVSPDVAPPDTRFIMDRGPFNLAAERSLFDMYGIEVVVSKNSGGDATYAKIEAARERGLPVIMVARPELPAAETVGDVNGAVERIAHLIGHPLDRGE